VIDEELEEDDDENERDRNPSDASVGKFNCKIRYNI